LVESPAELDDLLLRVRERVNGREWKYCEVRPTRFEPGMATRFAPSNRYLWHAIDLRPSLDAIFRNFHHSVQRKIRRAEREALTYEEGNSERLLRQFYQLVVATRRRQHLPPQPLNWFRSLIASLGANLKIRVASKDGTPIASILTLCHKHTVTYKYGCSDARMHPLGGVALLFWNTIQQGKAAGYNTLDLGRSDTSNEGLAAFKEHWGGIRAGLTYWRYPYRSEPRKSLAPQRIAEQIVKVAPDWALIAAGNLLYRHIG
jgi:lipid II:glycine glycyltransferase (peptidoglycan interpeptide bridge formation enzyme)